MKRTIFVNGQTVDWGEFDPKSLREYEKLENEMNELRKQAAQLEQQMSKIKRNAAKRIAKKLNDATNLPHYNKLFDILSNKFVHLVYSGKPGCMCGCRGEYKKPDDGMGFRRVLSNAIRVFAKYGFDVSFKKNGECTIYSDVAEKEMGRNYTIYCK